MVAIDGEVWFLDDCRWICQSKVRRGKGLSRRTAVCYTYTLGLSQFQSCVPSLEWVHYMETIFCNVWTTVRMLQVCNQCELWKKSCNMWPF